MVDNDIEHGDFLCDDSLSNIDDSFCESETDDFPKSIAIDISNGSPINIDDFKIVHYNINSITAEGRLEELNSVAQSLKIG